MTRPTTSGSRPTLSRDRWGAIIDGVTVTPDDADYFEVTDPTLGTRIADVLIADPELVDRAVSSSRAAFEEWRDRAPRDRSRLLRAVAQNVRDHFDELVEMEVLEVGKPKDIAASDVNACHTRFDFFASLADSLHGEVIDHGTLESQTIYEPYGVVAGILPFNWPPNHFARKAAPSLAAGNTVVIKPAEQAPLTALRLAELANEILPPGVINAVPGIGAGPALVANPLIERISFTGATATGQRVLEGAAQNVTYTTLELGGKNALLVLDDADVQTAVRIAIEGMFYNQGEACTSTSRLLVHESVHDEFLAGFTELTMRLVVGDGLDPRSHIGPMVDARHRERVLGYLGAALAEGATIHAQGTVPTEGSLADGYWVAPTILTNVDPQSTAGQVEMFGPIASVIPFRTDDEAIEIANGTPFGLTAAVCSADWERARRLSSRLHVGVVRINNYQRGATGAPFGGVRGSGFGRDGAVETLREFVRTKSVQYPSARGGAPFWPADLQP
jgi:acyl-CoA reductase-like NAD-dependent aldehyde dehydrogenase